VGSATWEYFPLPHRPSYWIQYTNTFETSIKFINNQWYNIFWSKTFNSYYTEGDQFVEAPEAVRLGTLANFLKTQETQEKDKSIYSGIKQVSSIK
jgi:hypothetical protein